MKNPAIPLVLLLSLGARVACCQAPASPAPSAAAAGTADQETEKKSRRLGGFPQPQRRPEAGRRAAGHCHAPGGHSRLPQRPTETPAGLHPGTGQPLSVMDRTLIAVSAMPKSIHDNLMAGLRQQLTPEQVEAVPDKYTIGKVAFTLNGYKSIVPNLTPTEEAVIVANLKQAREQAVDFKNMKEISAVFEIYKDKNEAYLNTHGRNWRELFKAYVDGVNAKKAADKAKAAAAPPASPK